MMPSLTTKTRHLHVICVLFFLVLDVFDTKRNGSQEGFSDFIAFTFTFVLACLRVLRPLIPVLDAFPQPHFHRRWSTDNGIIAAAVSDLLKMKERGWSTFRCSNSSVSSKYKPKHHRERVEKAVNDHVNVNAYGIVGSARDIEN